MSTHKRNSNGTLVACLALLAFSSGCGGFQMSPAAPVPEESSAPMRGDLVVELHDADDGLFHLKAPFKESMFVQDALRESGAIRRYRRMDITLVRELPNGQKLRMPVKYNSPDKSVTPATNYSLHPNDKIEVVQNAATTFDRMIESALKPLRPTMR